jgi:hypothetical protein
MAISFSFLPVCVCKHRWDTFLFQMSVPTQVGSVKGGRREEGKNVNNLCVKVSAITWAGGRGRGGGILGNP